jgi:hypothetical protein
LLKHKPWSKHHLLPTLSDEVTLDIFEEFRKSDKCPLSVNIALERAKIRKEMQKRGYTEPVAEEVIESQPINPEINDESRDPIHVTNHLIDTTDTFNDFEQHGFDLGKNYDWSRRINDVSCKAGNSEK